MIIEQKDIDVLLQSNKELSYKLELLNTDYKILDCIEGNLINDSISISADSDIRRIYNCTMLVTNSSFNIGKDKYIWFGRLIRPYIGIKHIRSGEMQWYLLGTFLYTDVNHEYNADNNTLSLTCLDMMALLNDKRGGQLQGFQRTIKRGTDARQVIISLLDLIGIKNYTIEFNLNNKSLTTFEIPNDMQYNAGTTVYTIVSDIVKLYPGTQMYFDINGYLKIERIPTTANEQYILNDEILNKIVISESTSTSLSDIYNRVQIFGRVNDADYYSTAVSYNNNVYSANVISYKIDQDTNEKKEMNYDKYINYDCIALRLPFTNQANPYININGLGNIPIVDDEHNTLKANVLKATDNVFRYYKQIDGNGFFLWLGEYQCFGEAIDMDGEYGIKTIGERLKVLSGGEYDKIYTNGLCVTRAQMELQNCTNKQVKLSLQTIAIPFLDVNDLIEYTPNGEQTGFYLVESINCNYAEYTMSIELSKYYEQQV